MDGIHDDGDDLFSAGLARSRLRDIVINCSGCS
jgi:hypothetical protein